MGLTRIVGEKRSGTVSRRLQGNDIILTETYHFLVECELPNEKRLTVLSNPELPVVGYTTLSNGAVCSSSDGTRNEENTHFWDVTCVFTTEPLRQLGGEPNSAPYEWIPMYSLSFEGYEAYSFKDALGKDYKNSAGDYFDDPISSVRNLIKLDFFQYELPYPLGSPPLTEYAISLRNDTVNELDFALYPPKTLKLNVRNATMLSLNNLHLWKIDYSMTFKPDTWIRRVRDRGQWFLEGTPPRKRKCIQGEPAAWVVGNLDGAGGLQPEGTLAAELEFDEFKPINFADFLRRGVIV